MVINPDQALNLQMQLNLKQQTLKIVLSINSDYKNITTGTTCSIIKKLFIQSTIYNSFRLNSFQFIIVVIIIVIVIVIVIVFIIIIIIKRL